MGLQADQRFMALALALGRRGMGQTWPNPAVGCVIVKNGRTIGRGMTAPGGRPHAEVQALAMAGPEAAGATAYVTLEPCAHHGQTGPCADALIVAGISRVVSAMQDPDPRTAGAGHAKLRAAGIDVTTGVMEPEARVDHAGFVSRILRQRPFVTLKLATSLDGRIAMASGESQWITGPQARLQVHAMRARHDAIMIGGGTARADDPMLNVRGFGAVRQPVRVVLSRGADVPLYGALAQSAQAQPLWLLHGDGAKTEGWAATGAQCLPCAEANGQLCPTSALALLAARGMTRVFCEGGGSLAASLLSADLVDELVLFTAGLAIGAQGRPALGPIGTELLADVPRLKLHSARAIGGDMMQVWRAKA